MRQHRFAAAALTLSVALAASAWSRGDDLLDGSTTGAPPLASTASSVAPADATAGRQWFAGSLDIITTDDGTTDDGEQPLAPLPTTVETSIEVLGTEQTPTAPTTSALPVTTVPSTPVTQTTVTQTPVTQTAVTQTTVTQTTAASATPGERGAQALARIGYDWRTRLPSWSITFAPRRSGVYGYTYVGEQRIEIFVRDEMSDGLLTHVVAHELGHAVDVSLNSSDDRVAWTQARGITAVQWWPGSGVTDFSTGAGDFAEAFAVWQIGAADYRGRAAGVPSADQLALVASLSNG